MSFNTAFGITEDDICIVLTQNAALVVNPDNVTLEALAEKLYNDWTGEFDRIEDAALDGGTEMDEQTDAAHAEIRAILVEQGVIKS